MLALNLYLNTFLDPQLWSGIMPRITYSCIFGTFSLWFSVFFAVLADVGHTICQRKKKYPKDCQSPGFEPNVFSFIGKLLRFAVQDEFTQKTQDLNPGCKEGSIPIMQLGV